MDAFAMQIISKIYRWYRRARLARESAIDLDRLVSHDENDAYLRTQPLPSTKTSNLGSDLQNKTTAKRSRARACIPNTTRWKFGLHAGFFASIVVLLSNLTLLLTGIIARDDTLKGIYTIAKGEKHRIAIISTAYHVLINVLSTILLTSTNYAMQILCAPTRGEIKKAHARGQWLDIGIMSVHNLWYIDRKRVIAWVLLAFSSAPLHLL
jgi:hypothetical protein